MDEENASAVESVGSLTTPRRLLRKGTHSCVECKRRKTRCFFDHLSAATCVGCQRRGTRCISQGLVDIPVTAPEEDPRSAERLKRIEQMLEDLSAQLLTYGIGNRHDTSPDQSLIPRSSAEDPAARNSWQNDGDGRDSVLGAASGLNTAARVQTTTLRGPGEDVTGLSDFTLPKFADTCRTLHAALPSQRDADILFGAGRAAVYLQALCNPYSQLFGEEDSVSASILSVLPPVDAHPVLLARKLMQLAICIQQLDPSLHESSLPLGLGASEAMHRYYSLASSMVICHDELLDSLEGLECLIYEGVYLVNCGNIRRALVSLRRASTLAQFLGLHRKAVPVALNQLDPATRVSGEVTWMHVAYLERYISLLLGMSTSITNAKFASEHKTAGESDGEWLEKVQVDVCEQIINRNQRGHYDLAATQRIDATMNRVANNIQANWWKPMDIRPGMTGDDVMLLVINAQMQIVHNNLLTVLHLPYLLRKDPEHQYDYNKTVCTFASREVLSRYITFRSIVRVVFCCRIVDFCALTAALTLLLAHLSGQGKDSAWLLPHQRPGDRALIENTIETLDELNRLNKDELTRETAKLARELLVLETESAKTGDTYSCSIVDKTQNDNSGGQGRRSLFLDIPYFGTVMLAPDASFSAPSPHSTSGQTQTANSYTISAPVTVLPTSSEQASVQFCTAASQPSDLALHLGQLPQHPFIADEGFGHPMGNFATTQQNEQLEMFDLPMPDVMADAADWAFQGVDITFFNNLINGDVTNQDAWDGNYLEF
ncbi:hypothetical protein BGZ61DRAFT_193461 [Ilyonectria robusta]|uniref:uncharacterized protein n=1 Tax=Ilyonectria robusta TaxID=1079257 RepID=UPI001E8CCEA8|nr:uncharacterized protein BGZ61DRAFT_193461 [Ilyonectria robusta]KAH8654839.1 hypothetical protein BGZ61DRAFT_193461 [Ilyonectria robusta]